MIPVSFQTEDGYLLKGHVFPANGKRVGSIIVAGATGVPQGFYKRYAQFASEQGFDVLTFDYRGIGLSKPVTLNSFEMDMLDWGKYDLASAVELMSQDESIPLFVVGHSYGGHAFGLLPNHTKVKGFYVYGTGAGWHGYMPLTEQIKVLTMWYLILPIIVRWKGYCAWSLLGMGEDLPKNVFLQWRHWCRFKHYFFDDPNMHHIHKLYAAVKTPVFAVNALDDLWAMPASRDAFIKHYSSTSVSCVDIDHKNIKGKIGHMGYFRKHAEPLWLDNLNWFKSLIANEAKACLSQELGYKP